MTRILAELLDSPEHIFKQKTETLERMSGHVNADIRLTAEVMRGAKVKLHQLGLDPHDTTGEELYASLQEKIAGDDRILQSSLAKTSKSDDQVAAVAHALRTVPIPRSCFALRPSVAKRLLKQLPPKKTMKQLGYRSLDSMLKHESVFALLAAAQLIESDSWRRSLVDSYKSLTVKDFESRDIAIINPVSNRWQQLGNDVIAIKRHNIISFRELGAIILLPLPDKRPPAVTLTLLVLALQSINEIRSASTYLKLCHVRANFGDVVKATSLKHPHLDAVVSGEALEWQVVQRYYARFKEAFRSEVFEPHVQPEDLSWHSIELVLQHLDERLSFWRGTAHLNLKSQQGIVSFNIIDAVLNHCNQFHFSERLRNNAQVSLWHELLLKYLKHNNVEQTVMNRLQAQLVPEIA